MIALPYDYFLIGWFTSAALSTAHVAVDQFRNNPEPTVMKWGFILVTLYMGPFGLLLYVLADMLGTLTPGSHEEALRGQGNGEGMQYSERVERAKQGRLERGNRAIGWRGPKVGESLVTSDGMPRHD